MLDLSEERCIQKVMGRVKFALITQPFLIVNKAFLVYLKKSIGARTLGLILLFSRPFFFSPLFHNSFSRLVLGVIMVIFPPVFYMLLFAPVSRMLYCVFFSTQRQKGRAEYYFNTMLTMTSIYNKLLATINVFNK